MRISAMSLYPQLLNVNKNLLKEVIVLLVEMPRTAERIGALTIYDTQKVLKLESSRNFKDTPLIKSIPYDVFEEYYHKFAVIVPIKNESLKLFEGVLSAIPQDVTVIVVSNSYTNGFDRYRMERDILKSIHKFSQQPMMIIHQKDPGLVEALRTVRYEYILEGDTVRSGKGEGMIIGILMTKALGLDYLGFVDSDNYIPSAVNEYIKDYIAGFYMSDSPYTMVRLLWKYKPKIVESSLYFRRWGRVSVITNRYMNLLVGRITGFETDVIKTGNAGEHAMTTKLAEIMAFASGFAIEPYELVYLFEEFGKFMEETKFKEAVREGIKIYQIETLNPHLHEEKGRAHIIEMIAASLGSIYHSRVADQELRVRIVGELDDFGLKQEPPKPRIIPPIVGVDANRFFDVLQSSAQTLEILE